MADDTRDRSSKSSMPSTTAPPAPGSALPKKFPKGVVLGKDGKPCRSCTSFAAWSALTATTLTSPTAPPPSCPPSVETLGQSSWTLLHSIAATYPTAPTATERSNLTTFMTLFSTLYPCWTCAEEFQEYLRREKIRVGSRDEFGRWLCEAHNDVNERLGKERFDCGKWEERWRTGAKGC